MDSHTAAAELSMEGTSAVIRLGPRMGSLLAERGFSPGGDVVARLTWERLEIRPVRVRQTLVEKVDEITQAITWLEGLMRNLLESLPEVSDAMAAHEVPYTVEADLRATLEVVLADDITTARQALEEASQVTPERLRADWERQRGDRG
jgi:hypothetical protein